MNPANKGGPVIGSMDADEWLLGNDYRPTSSAYEEEWNLSSTTSARDRILQGLERFPVGHARTCECTRRRKYVRDAVENLGDVLDKIQRCAPKFHELFPGAYRSESAQHIRRAQSVAESCKALVDSLKELERQDRLCCRCDDSGRGASTKVGRNDLDDRGDCIFGHKKRISDSSSSKEAVGADDAGDVVDPGAQLLPPLMAMEYSRLRDDIQRIHMRAEHLLEELRVSSTECSLSDTVSFVAGLILAPLYLACRPCSCTDFASGGVAEDSIYIHDSSNVAGPPRKREGASSPPR